jgi:hypothetical protein
VKTLKFNNPDMRLYCASMGKLFRVTAVCKSDAEANQIMARDSDQALIATDCNGLNYLANQYGSTCPSAVVEDLKP